MSRGLGCMQQAIIDRLKARPGGDVLVDNCGHRAWLDGSAHDLRKVSCELASRMGGISHCNHVTGAWSAGFSRAIAKLADRGALNTLWLVPLEAAESELAWPSIDLAGGLYLQWFSKQRRFVGKRPNFLTLNAAYASECRTF